MEQRGVLPVLFLFLASDTASASLSGRFNTPGLFRSAFLSSVPQFVNQLQRNHSHFKQPPVTLPLLTACLYPFKVGSHNKGLLGEEKYKKS